MKILVIGDLHGRKPRIHFKDFDCIIQVGDVCDDSKIGPHIKEWFELLKKEETSFMESDQFIISKIGKGGLKKLEKESLERGHEILKYLNSLGKPIFMVAGNWDQSYGPSKIKDLNKSDYNYRKSFYDWYLGDKINPKLVQGLKKIKNVMFKNYQFEGINLLGYGLSSGAELLKKKVRN